MKKYIDDIKPLVVELGYVETLSGRRRFLPEIHSNNPMIRAAAERTSVNTPVQGTNADIIKIAMISLYKQLQNVDDAKMILQVHDELVFEVRDDVLEKVARLVKNEMENAMKLNVPIVVEPRAGKNWAGLKLLAL